MRKKWGWDAKGQRLAGGMIGGAARTAQRYTFYFEIET